MRGHRPIVPERIDNRTVAVAPKHVIERHHHRAAGGDGLGDVVTGALGHAAHDHVVVGRADHDLADDAVVITALVADGDPVTVGTERGAVTLPAAITELPDQVVWLPTNSPGSTLRRALGPAKVVTVSGGTAS